jgi:hypothetical protein
MYDSSSDGGGAGEYQAVQHPERRPFRRFPPQQPTAKLAVPKYLKHLPDAITVAVRAGSLGGDCRSIGKHLTFAAFSDDGLNRRKSDASLNWDRLPV